MDFMERIVHRSVENAQMQLVTKKVELVLEDVRDAVVLHFAKVRILDCSSSSWADARFRGFWYHLKWQILVMHLEMAYICRLYFAMIDIPK